MDELDNFLNIPVCTFDAMVQIETQCEEEKAHQFLMGFNADMPLIGHKFCEHGADADHKQDIFDGGT